MEIKCCKLSGRRPDDDHDATCCKRLKLTPGGGSRVFFFFNYLFIYLWLCWVFVSVRGLISSCGKRGATLHRGARASHYRGLSCCGAQAPDAQAQ